MDHKLGPTILSRDDLELLCLEVAKVIDILREYALVKTRSVDSAKLTLSSGLLDAMGMKPGEALPSVSELEELRAWLEQTKSTAPEIHITLPALPASQLKGDIVAWFRAEINPLALVTFEYNRALAGGFVLRSGSEIHDFSFRKALLTNSGAMVKVMKRLGPTNNANTISSK